MNRQMEESFGITVDGVGDLASEPVNGYAPSLSLHEIDFVDLEGDIGQGGLSGSGQVRCPEDDDPVFICCVVQGQDMGSAVDDDRQSANTAFSE